MTWLLDLDGVVWRGHAPIPGSSEAIAKLQAAGQRVGYVTNNSAGVGDQVAKLGAMGIAADAEDIVNGPMALATQMQPGWRVLCVAIEGMRETLEAEGMEVTMGKDVKGSQPPEVDAVVISYRTDGELRELSLAVRGVLQCGRLFAPSADPLYPVSDGFDIGGGSLTAAVTYATGVEAVYGGKPFEPMTTAVRKHFDDIEMMVGDQTKTDGGLAQGLGVPFLLVRSGVTSAGGRMDRTDVPIAHEYDSLLEAVNELL